MLTRGPCSRGIYFFIAHGCYVRQQITYYWYLLSCCTAALLYCCPASEWMTGVKFSHSTSSKLQTCFWSKDKSLWRKMFYTMWSAQIISEVKHWVVKNQHAYFIIAINRPASHLHGDNKEEDWICSLWEISSFFLHKKTKKKKHFQKYTPLTNKCKREPVVVQKGAYL